MSLIVMPAEAATHVFEHGRYDLMWTPAFAGATGTR
jgi:hypothetical protein